MKINKILFFLSCTLLVGCSGEITKEQQSNYSDTLQDKYPEYNYSYMNKQNQYEIEFTKDIKQVFKDNNTSNPNFYKSLVANNFSDISSTYLAVPLSEVFEDEGDYREDILETTLKSSDESELEVPFFSALSDDVFSVVMDKPDTTAFYNLASRHKFPNYNKLVKVLTKDFYLFSEGLGLYLVKNIDDTDYTFYIHDKETFDFIEKIYFAKDSANNKNKTLSLLLAINKGIEISVNTLQDRISREEVNESLVTLNNFLIENKIRNNYDIELLSDYLNQYFNTGNIDFSLMALKITSNYRTSFLADLLANSDSTKTGRKSDLNSEPEASIPEYPEKDTGDNIYRLDGLTSKYTYSSSLINNAISEVVKLSKVAIKNNYIVQENEIGQLGITIYSQEIQDEVVENYIFDPYTKKITIREEYSPDNLESVSMIINEAISVIKQETIYGNQPGYIMDGYVTDDGYIAVDINISDNNSGEIIKQDQAVYNPETHLIKEFPKNSPTTSNNDVNENSIIKEAISIVEEKTGYIEGSPYVYEAYENEEDGSVVVEVRSAGAGTMSIVDRFKYLSDTKDVYIYDTPSNSYNPY